MARRRRRGQGYPTSGLDVSTAEGGSGGIANAGFEPMDVLSEAEKSGGSTQGINIYNTAIAQAAAEQGPGGIGQTATAGHGGGGGGGQHHHHQAGQHHHHR